VDSLRLLLVVAIASKLPTHSPLTATERVFNREQARVGQLELATPMLVPRSGHTGNALARWRGPDRGRYEANSGILSIRRTLRFCNPEVPPYWQHALRAC
jgi:hypothetical protein